jgi:UDP-N-acetylglucosamine pyrophosphorylase
MFEESFREFESRMRAAGASAPAIAAFRHNYSRLVSGDAGLIPEDQIQPVETLPSYTDISRDQGDPGLLAQLLVVKLNGGLGTSMGLERAKSLLTVKQGLTFMDLIVRQILHLRVRHRTTLRFALMNSFSTSKDTFEALKKYPEIGEPLDIELMQSQVPKVDSATLRPISWPENPHLEWCPPGHGDFYTSLYATGMLERLLAKGVKYVFISNSDNLGATPDVSLLTYFARAGLEFMMEAAARTQADRKGGHLARRGKTLLLRESAQCPEQDMKHFQDVERHRFFNTNNLWLRLDALEPHLKRSGGFLPLPLIKNTKTVDPRKKSSPAVFQLETAMGAAIQAFEKPGAVLVPRSRFAPVKTTNDLLALRSDAYRLTEDWRIVLENPGTDAQPPDIDLDPAFYKIVDGLEDLIVQGVPSLRDCSALKVRGAVRLSSKLIFRGSVGILNSGQAPVVVPPGTYQDREWSPD